MKRRIFWCVLISCLACVLIGALSATVVAIAYVTKKIQYIISLALPLALVALGGCLLAAALLSRLFAAGVSGRICDIEESLKSLNEGEYRPLLTDSGDEELYSVLCQINDLNEKTHRYIRKQTEQKQKLSVVLENVCEGIVALNAQNRIMFANSHAAHIFESSGALGGLKLEYLISDSALCSAIIEAGEPLVTIEHTRAGRYYTFVVSSIPKSESSSGISKIIVISDVTKEKSIAKEKSDFFANASHELKTPITVMQGHSELLLAKGTLGESETRQIERIHKECVRLSDLISDMLKLSLLERKEQELNNVDISLRSVSDDVLGELSELILKKNISTKISGDAILSIDQKKIYELVGNLCTNAVKYNKDNGSISIDISADGQSTVLSVSDTGIGISHEHIPRLCERFYRVDKSRSKKTGGTGLGLAIVKHICVLYDAELKIESVPNEGTTVRVRFTT